MAIITLTLSLSVSGCGDSAADAADDTVSSTFAEEANDAGSTDAGEAKEAGSASAVDLSYVDDDGNIVIPLGEIGKTAVFAGYMYDDTVMEIFAVLDEDGALHYALNTCQVCSGSPYAYYEQDGSSFICQNCGNVFRVSQVGEQKGGCNPVPLETAAVEENRLTVTKDALSEYVDYFRNWKGLN